MASGGFARPRVAISRCIEFDHCRYNGDMIGNALVRRLIDSGGVDFVPVCMEAEIGLGVPREPVRIIQGRDGARRLLQPATGRDVTDLAQGFSEGFMSSVGELDGLILKSRSPSCGVRDAKLYPKLDSPSANARGPGIFGEAALRHFPLVAIEDENRLRNVKLAEHFLTRAFTSASWRRVEAKGRMADLVEWHSDHKLLLMMYGQKGLKLLGNVLANREGASLADLKAAYRQGLLQTLRRLPGCNASVNVLQHCLGFVSGRLTAEERAFFLEQLRMYREARVPLSVPLGIMRSWVVRFQEPYLVRQAFFAPFPEGLMEVELTDSCGLRDLSDGE